MWQQVRGGILSCTAFRLERADPCSSGSSLASLGRVFGFLLQRTLLHFGEMSLPILGGQRQRWRCSGVAGAGHEDSSFP